MGSFLTEEPLLRLPDCYSIWEETLDKLKKLMDTKELRKHVAQWPFLQPKASSLPSERHWQRAYLVLTFVGQAYIWIEGSTRPSSLPQVLAKPWYEVSEHLGLPPVTCYAAVVLYNWRVINPELGVIPDNLKILHTLLITFGQFHISTTGYVAIDYIWFLGKTRKKLSVRSWHMLSLL